MHVHSYVDMCRVPWMFLIDRYSMLLGLLEWAIDAIPTLIHNWKFQGLINSLKLQPFCGLSCLY